MSDLTTQIETEAAKAQTVTVDGQTIVRRTLKEQIEADQYLKANQAAGRGAPWGLRFAKIVPPGGG
jgi:hypothetical protein